MKIVDDYRQHLKEQGYLESSINELCNGARRWLSFAKDGGDKQRCTDYLSRWTNPRTRVNKLNNIKMVVKFMAGAGMCSDWTSGVRVKRIKKESYVILSPQEVGQIINRCWHKDPWIRERDRTILILLYQTACRHAEIRLIRREHIDLLNSTVTVKIKGGRTVDVHLPQQSVDQLKRWMAMNDGEWLFPARSDRKGKAIGTTMFRKIVVDRTREAGIDKAVSPHTFRRAAATASLRAGAKLEEVQSLLHHTCIESTLVYVRIADNATATMQDALLKIASLFPVMLESIHLMSHYAH